MDGNQAFLILFKRGSFLWVKTRQVPQLYCIQLGVHCTIPQKTVKFVFDCFHSLHLAMHWYKSIRIGKVRVSSLGSNWKKLFFHSHSSKLQPFYGHRRICHQTFYEIFSLKPYLINSYFEAALQKLLIKLFPRASPQPSTTSWVNLQSLQQVFGQLSWRCHPFLIGASLPTTNTHNIYLDLLLLHLFPIKSPPSLHKIAERAANTKGDNI